LAAKYTNKYRKRCKILNNKLISFWGIVRKSGNMVCGSKNVREAAIKGKIKAVLIPDDTSDNTLDQILSVIKHKKDIKIIYLSCCKEDLSGYIGKYAGAVGIKSQNMIRKVEELISQKHEEECIICPKNTEYTK
jgi:ribosomal protein L7Ae-like RNA K-turn-binding protein